MKLPDHRDTLPREQARCDGFDYGRLFHAAAHILMRTLWTRWCPESDLNQRPTAYEKGTPVRHEALPGGFCWPETSRKACIPPPPMRYHAA
jgi:hypothetical protein